MSKVTNEERYGSWGIRIDLPIGWQIKVETRLDEARNELILRASSKDVIRTRLEALVKTINDVLKDWK